MSTISRKEVQTERLRISCLEAGSPEHEPVLLLHGNVSSSLFWTDTIEFLSDRYWVLAPDMRGYGETQAEPIDATRGLRDWSEDLAAFLQTLRIDRAVHLVGWSLGAGVLMQLLIDRPGTAASLTLLNPMSPFGFGGTKDVEGTPCHADFAGSGGGTANPVFVERLKNGDRTDEDPNSPRNVLNQFYIKPPFRAEKEEQYVTSMLATHVGPGLYPGTFVASANWPGVAPGAEGINNAIAPKYVNLSSFSSIEEKPPVLWIRGADDTIVSDTSFLEFGYLGQLGYVPDWPGPDVYPPQPMVSQMRFVLDQYEAGGGSYEEVVIEEAGHSLHIEKPEDFRRVWSRFVTEVK